MERFLIYTEVFPSDGSGVVRQTGVGRYCCELATGLAELGHQVTVLTNRSQGEGLEPGRAGFALERLGSAPRGIFSVVRRAREVRRAVAASGAGVLIAGDVIAHRVLAAAGAPASTLVLPVLYGSELRSFRSLFRDTALSPGRRLRRALVRRYLARAFGAVCISGFVRRELETSPMATRRRAVVYPSVRPMLLTRPPDPSFRLPGGTAGRPTALRLLTIGRISERKNQLQVLRALVALRDRAGLVCQYYMLGNVDADVHSPYGREIDAFITEHGLREQVVLLSGTSDEEKTDCIDACDVVVAVSRTVGISTEGFGISAIEASARGRPVIVSREGGMPETIIEGATGISVSAEPDADELTRALEMLAGRPELRRRMGEAGRELVRERFTPRRTAASLTSWLQTERHEPDASRRTRRRSR